MPFRINKKIRKLWHTLYFRHASEEQIKFSLTCKEFVGLVDSMAIKRQPKNIVRLLVHYTFCQACANYYNFTRILRTHKLRNTGVTPNEIKTFNKELVREFTEKPQEPE